MVVHEFFDDYSGGDTDKDFQSQCEDKKRRRVTLS